MIDLYPKKCNICGGDVEYISNDKIYGKKYGSGFCYHCKNCGAYVGTHKPRPKEALGILANDEMKKWKQWCHNLFDRLWKYQKIEKNGKIKIIPAKMTRSKAYYLLAKELNIPIKECHFGYFNVSMLKRAYAILKNNFRSYYGE